MTTDNHECAHCSLLEAIEANGEIVLTDPSAEIVAEALRLERAGRVRMSIRGSELILRGVE
jgi:hypothetical protein